MPEPARTETPTQGSALEVLAVATRLGLTSFGGPVAHLGYFRSEYVERRRWLTDEVYADIVALCQALPGPASSQTGIAIGILRAGLLGGLMAWIGFTLPSALAMIGFAYGIDALGDVQDAGWLHGLKIAAVAVVAFAVWGMSRSLTPDLPRALMAVAAAIVMLLWQTALAQLLIIVAGGLIGWRVLPSVGVSRPGMPSVSIGRNLAMASFAAFAGLLIVLPGLRVLFESQTISMLDSFFRAGALVFGGGHVVLPLLEAEVVGPGWVTDADFLAGYGAAQALPGPLFTFSAYLGAASQPEPNGAVGGLLALLAIFLPSFFLVVAGLPLWSLLSRSLALQSAMRGVNAAVVGLLLAALYNPVWRSAIFDATDFALAAICLALLFRKIPPWAVVIVAATGGQALAAM